MLPKLIVFDFDGVILESADIKTRAFHQLFAAHPDKLDAIVAHHEANAGVSRFKKFQHIHRHILGKPLSSEEERMLGERFEALVIDEVTRCQFVPGAMEFLQAHSRTHPLFVASGTPEGELRRIVAARGLAPFFREVYGSPMEKASILERILAVMGVPQASLVFVGDGRSDYEAAKTAGVGFIGRARPGRRHPFDGLEVPLIADLFELDRHFNAQAGSSV